MPRSISFVGTRLHIQTAKPNWYFVEVKLRRGTGFGRPEEAVSRSKQKLLFQAAEMFLHANHFEGILCRFDVIAILQEQSRYHIEHFRDVYQDR